MTEKRNYVILSCSNTPFRNCSLLQEEYINGNIKFPELSWDEIIQQMQNSEPLISDEEAFLTHLIKEWERE